MFTSLTGRNAAASGLDGFPRTPPGGVDLSASSNACPLVHPFFSCLSRFPSMSGEVSSDDKDLHCHERIGTVATDEISAQQVMAQLYFSVFLLRTTRYRPCTARIYPIERNRFISRPEAPRFSTPWLGRVTLPYYMDPDHRSDVKLV